MSDTLEEQLAQVWQEHGRALQAATTTWLHGDRAAADDVVQETLVRLWRNRDVIDNGRAVLRAWLLTVARNLCIDRYRARKVRPHEVKAEEMPADREPRVRDQAEAIATAMEIGAALDTLTAEHREIVTRVYLRDQKLSDIATELGIPTGTVKSRSYYALRALQSALKPLDEV